MPLTREPKYKGIYTDEVDQKGGYVAKVRDKEARAAAKEAAETAKADLDAYKETNDAAVADLDDRLDQAELDIGAAEDAIDELEDALDVLILVQDAQPTTPDNKIWIKETATPVVIPEMSDIADFVSFAEDQTSRTDAEKAQARDNIGAEKPWVKVWENASPESNFAEQDVAINLSGYSELLIPFTRNAYVQSGWNIVQTAHFNITDMEGAAVTCNAVYDANGRIGRRIISSISSTGFHVAGGNKMTSYGGGYSADNSILVPLFVYAR